MLSRSLFKFITKQRRVRTSVYVYSFQTSSRLDSSHLQTTLYIPHEHHIQQHNGRQTYPTMMAPLNLPTTTDSSDDDTTSSYNYDPYEDCDANAGALNTDYEMDTDLPNESSLSQLDIYDAPRPLSSASDLCEDHEEVILYDTESSEPVTVDANSPILRSLNSNQVDAVTKPIQSITRVIAGPGSGKTRVLTNRIAWLLQQNTHDRIVAVTFTRKASNEMQDRLRKLIYEQEEFATKQSKRKLYIDEGFIDDETSSYAEEALRRVTLGTFHSVCTKILRWNGEYLLSLPSIQSDIDQSKATSIVLDSNFNIVDPQGQLRILKETLDEYKIKISDCDDMKFDHILKSLNTCKTKLYNGEHPFVPTTSTSGPKSTIEIASLIYYRFREKVLSTNSLDFDDLMYLTRELLVSYDTIRLRLQQRWQHIFVDEYQDTSKVQVELIKLLTTKSLFVVGDADQSIYAWRGAYVESLYDFENEFHKYNFNGVSTVYLMENYRSTAKIVAAAQKVISHSDSMSTANKLRREMIPLGSEGSEPRIMSFEDGESEAKYLVKNIKTQLSSGTYGPDHTLAFIYRTNAQSRLIEEACVRYNVPYVVSGKFNSFYNRQEIKDCLCFLRWLHNGRDRVAMLRAVETPKRGIGDVAIREFDQYCEQVEQHWNEQYHGEGKPNALEVLFHLSGDNTWCRIPNPEFPLPYTSLSSRSHTLFIEFSRKLVEIRENAERTSLSKTLQDIVDRLELKPHFDKISKSEDELKERLANVDELMKAAAKYDDHGACLKVKANTLDDSDAEQSPLGYFLDDISLVTEHADSTDDNGHKARFVANLMTIHSSKGMEFDSVYFVGVEDGTIPSSQALRLEEESTLYDEEEKEKTNFILFDEEDNAKSILFNKKKKEKGIPFDEENSDKSISFDIKKKEKCIPSDEENNEKSNSVDKEVKEKYIPFDEEKRLCYVAMTRAKSELLMTYRKNVMIFTSSGLKRFRRVRSRFLDVLHPKKNDSSMTENDFPLAVHSAKAITTSRHKIEKVKSANEIKAWSSNAKPRQHGANWPPPTSNFTGTASAYKSIPAKSLTVMKSEKANKNKISPRRPIAPIMARSSVSTTGIKVTSSVSTAGNMVKSPHPSEIVDSSLYFTPMKSRSLLSARKYGAASSPPTLKHIPNPIPPLMDSRFSSPIGYKVRYQTFRGWDCPPYCV